MKTSSFNPLFIRGIHQPAADDADTISGGYVSIPYSSGEFINSYRRHAKTNYDDLVSIPYSSGEFINTQVYEDNAGGIH